MTPYGYVLIEPLEHWCTDHNCGGAELLETRGNAIRIRRWRASTSPRTARAFDTKQEAMDWAASIGLEVRE